MIEADQVKQDHLQSLGFNRLGSSPLFRRNSFLLAVDKGNYQFFVDYIEHLDPANVKGIKIGERGEGMFAQPHLVVVSQYPDGNVALNETLLGGSGRSGRAEDPRVIEEFNGKPLNQQLVETGFSPVDELIGVYKTVFDSEHHGETDIYVLLEEDRVNRIVHPALKSYPTRERGREFVRGLGIDLTGFETRRGSTRGYDFDVLTARNSTMELEFSPNGEFRITRQLRDIEPKEIGVTPVTPVVEPTGFVVGGTNSTELIRQIPSLNGISIEQLEGQMRRGDIDSDAGIGNRYEEILKTIPAQDVARRKEFMAHVARMNTEDSFLGDNESLRQVLAEDNDYVRGLGLTHQDLGRMIRYTTALSEVLGLGEFTYQGRRYSTSWIGSIGSLESPFEDGTEGGDEFTIKNETTGAKFHALALHGDMIERYGFYEGKRVGYRVEPKDVVEVFDFLKDVGQQRLAARS